MRLVTTETIEEPVRHGELIYACAVSGANVLRDMREAITNTIGGADVAAELRRATAEFQPVLARSEQA